MSRVICGLMFLFVSIAAATAASETTQPSGVVGSVYDKPVTAADIGMSGPIDVTVQFDSRDAAHWELMGRVMRAFGGPVIERFVADRKIEATAEEIAACRKHFRQMAERLLQKNEIDLAKTIADLTSPDPADEEKAKLEKRRKTLETIVNMQRETANQEIPESIARQMIAGWKTERELHRVYGGKVIFQQSGIEALDARRLLFEAAEKSGDLKFDDAGVRRLFYYYYVNVKHTPTNAKALEKAWFLGDAE